MKIRLLSDLHHEFMTASETEGQNYMEYRGEDVLVLAGDIAVGATNVMETIKKFLNLGFPQIVYVPGNHEYYRSSIRQFNANMNIKTLGSKNVHFMNPGTFQIGDVLFIGAPLWTNFRGDVHAKLAAHSMISDFRYIDGFSPEHSVLLYNEHLAFIKKMYEIYPAEKKVIITHFLPAVECISPRFKGEGLLNNYFANDLGEWISTLSNTTWMFGHTHDSVDIMIGETRVVANPYGYWGNSVNPEFDNYKVIEV